jgi:polysaccharide biosynthesis protein PslG
MTGFVHARRSFLPGAVRRSVAAAVSALAAVSLVAALVGVSAPQAQASTLDVSGAPAGISPGGSFPYLSDAELTRELDLYAASGVRWLRLDMPWSVIESTKGRFEWTRWDKVVSMSRARGINVLGILAYAPSWATGQTDDKFPPNNPADYGAFAGAAASHFAGQVAAYEIWNEPNVSAFWRPAPSASGYVNLLKAAYPAIKAADPNATVLAGALCPAYDTGTTIMPTTFTAKLYSLGAKPFFDAVSVHPYSFPALPSDPSTYEWNTFYRVTMMRTTMVNNGDGAKRIWLTEFGAPTGTHADAVSEAEQAAEITDGFRFARSLGYTGPLFVFSGRDRGTNIADREQNFGVVRYDWSEKPGMPALRAAAGTTTTAPTTSSPAPTLTTSTLPATAPSTPPPPAAPAAPVTVSVGAITRSSALISWAPGSAGSAPITDYVLQYSSNGSSWTTWQHTPTTAMSLKLTGLRSGTTYKVLVALSNAVGTGAFLSTSFRTSSRSRTYSTSSYTASSVRSGGVVSVSRTLTRSARVRAALRNATAVAIFDPSGIGRPRAIALVRISRTATLTFRLVPTTSGRLYFRFLVNGRWRLTPAHTIRMVKAI